MLDFTEAVTHRNLLDMVDYAPERQVRKVIVQSELIVSEIVCYEPGQFTKMHVHPHQDEIFYCLEGSGAITFAEQDDVPIAPGCIVFVPHGVRHGVVTDDGSRLVLMFTKGPGLPNPNRPAKKAETATDSVDAA